MILTLRSKLLHAVFAFSAAILFPLLAQAGIEDHIIETESGFYYTVQKGDTLWDLSQKFSDTAWQWPDLWHYNPAIGNPHLIYPGQRIRIYQKSWAEMQTQKQPESGSATATARPKPTRYHVYTAINALGFIREKAVEPTGTIFKVKEDKELVSTGDKVYIRPASSGELKAGSLYTVYRTSDPVLDPVTKDYIGIQHLITGVVEITLIEKGFVIGQIKETSLGVEKDDKLMPFPSRSERIAFSDPVAGLSGRIIKAEDERIMIGEHMTAFINKGSRDGVKPGQSYRLYHRETSGTRTFMSEPVTLSAEYMGSLMVLHTEETTSTVLITNSVDSITSGLAFEPFDSVPEKEALLPNTGE